MGRVHKVSSVSGEDHVDARKSPVSRPVPDSSPDEVLEALQRAAGNAAVGQLLRSNAPGAAPTGGERLPPSLQAAAETRLGTDMSSVRVHRDADAAAYAAGLGAQAVTVGRHVYARDADPSTSAGRRTLLHELVHVAQSPSDVIEQPRALSARGSAAEVEARQIAASGLGAPAMKPVATAPAGIAHLKAVDEKEDVDETAAVSDPAQPKVTAEELLNPAVDPDASTGPEPGKSGENEGVVYEISIMQPLRATLSAVQEQDWEKALSILQTIGMPLMNYQNAYEKSDPLLHATLMSARGWLGMVYSQLNRRMDRDVWSDDQITKYFETEVVAEFQRIEGMLH